MTVTVFIQGVQKNVDKSSPYADDTFRIEVGDLDSGGFTDGSISQTTGQPSASYSAISAMTADAVYRSVKVHVTVDGVQYTQTKIQQIVKAVSSVETFGPYLVDPIVNIPRSYKNNRFWPNYTGAGGGRPENGTKISLKFRRIIDGAESFVTYQHPDDGTDNNRYWVDDFGNNGVFSDELSPTSPIDNSYSNEVVVASDNVTARLYVYLSYTQILSSNAVYNAYVEIPIKYRDTTGTVHTFRERQPVLITTTNPPREKHRIRGEHTFSEGSDLSNTYSLGTIHSYGVTGTDTTNFGVVLRQGFSAPGELSTAATGYYETPWMGDTLYSTDPPIEAELASGDTPDLVGAFSGISDSIAGKAVIMRPTDDMRVLPSESTGYILFEDIAWGGSVDTSEERNVYLGFDLYSASGTTLTPNTLTYRGSLVFNGAESETEGYETLIKMNEIDTSSGDVIYSIYGNGITPDRTTRINSQAADSTDVVYIPGGHNLYLVMRVTRPTSAFSAGGFPRYKRHRNLPIAGKVKLVLYLTLMDINPGNLDLITDLTGP